MLIQYLLYIYIFSLYFGSDLAEFYRRSRELTDGLSFLDSEDKEEKASIRTLIILSQDSVTEFRVSM